jgi:type 1 glutamine amidotransferase
MIRPRCSWLLLCGVLGCGSETPIPNSAGGSSNGSGSGGASAGNSSTGAGGAITAGSAGQPASGGAAGSGAGTAGASSGGMGGSAGGSAGAGGTPNVPTLPKRVLLYHFSTLIIGSVPAQLSLLESQLESWDFEVVVSDDPADLTAANLATFGGVGMINTCFEPFGAGQSGEAEAAALKTFVENGGGLFGTHCATVTFQSANPPHPYNQLIGGRGGDGNSEATSACRKTAEQHVATDMLPANFSYTGNLDNADYVAPDSKVLVMCKWSDNGMKDTAVSWYRTPGQGRVFYTNFAKEDVDLDEATIGQKHILLGLRWTLRL